MKNFIFLLFLLISNFSYGGDKFSPIPRMLTEAKENWRGEYTGVIFKEDTENYYVLTCVHPLFDRNDIDTTYAHVFTEGESDVSFVSVKCKLLKRDDMQDLCLYSFKKNNLFTVTPLELGDEVLPKNTILKNYGYTISTKLKEANVTVVEFDDQFNPGMMITVGPVKSGYSGGPAVHEKTKKVYGIQSLGGTGGNNYLSSISAIKKFVK